MFLLLGLIPASLSAQSTTCEPGMVENGNNDPWSEECYLNNSCAEAGNPCQANDVRLSGIFLQSPGGGDVPACNVGEVINVDLWGTFLNNTNTDRYAVRTRTEVFVNGVFLQELINCSFDLLPAGASSEALIGNFSYNCGDVISLQNTWIGWSTSNGNQCSDPLASGYTSECGEYPPAKCSKELGVQEFLAPNFTYVCGIQTPTTTEIIFTDATLGGVPPYTYAWDFGDGNTSTLASPTHIYQATTGVYNVELTVTDANGTMAGVFVMIDLGAVTCCELVIFCPADLTINCDESELPVNTGTATSDPCFPGVTITYADAIIPGNCPFNYTIERTWTATAGTESVNCLQLITVQDIAAPTITCPANVTVECDQNDQPPATGVATATDNCSLEADITIDHTDNIIAGTCADEYTIERTWTAEDECGNVSNCLQIVEVVDTTPPTANCPAPVSVECIEEVPAPDVSLVTTSDNCGTVTVIFLSDVSDGNTCPEVITRTWTATDACGNASSCTQTINVDDTEAPVITCPSSVTLECDDDKNPINTGSATATDNCTNPLLDITYTDQTISGSCENNYVIERTWTAVDECGNASSCVQLLTVQDTEAPVIICPSDITLDCTMILHL